MILVFGSVNIDLVTRAPIPRPGETVLAARYDRWFGGKGANQAVAAARARRDPAMPVRFAGAVGRDAFGQEARENLLAAGVDVVWLADTDLPTGCAFITVDPAGENAITVASGANLAARADAVPDHALREAALLVLQMEVPLAETLALARRASAAGVRVMLNLAPAPAADAAPETREAVDALLRASDVVLVNEHEALMARPFGGSDPIEAAAALAQACGAVVVVTLGAAGAAAVRADGGVVRVPAPVVDPVDTTGAGDTFAGILAAALAGGMALEPAMARACRGAALACLQPGAQPGMPTAAMLD